MEVENKKLRDDIERLRRLAEEAAEEPRAPWCCICLERHVQLVSLEDGLLSCRISKLLVALWMNLLAVYQ